MKNLAVIPIVLSLSLTPVAAQETKDEGIDLLEEGARMILRGLIDEMEPAIDDFRQMMDEFGPAMQEFVAEAGPVLAEMLRSVDNLRYYEQPEFLPNGDIIIRRSPDAPEWTPPKEFRSEDSIEL